MTLSLCHSVANKCYLIIDKSPIISRGTSNHEMRDCSNENHMENNTHWESDLMLKDRRWSVSKGKKNFIDENSPKNISMHMQPFTAYTYI